MSVQVPKGYKQTEVGVIPEDWEIPALGELITEMRGGAPFRPSDFTSSGVKVLPKGGVGRSGWLRIQDNEMQYCSPRYAFAHRRNQVNDEFTIVVLRDLVPSGPSIGLMVQIRDSESYVLAQGVYGFKVNDRAAPKYLVQLSNTSWYRKLANSIMVGSTQVHITNTAFKLAKIPLPSLDEQQAIAEALSDADVLIESLEQLIGKKRQIKQGAMQELLTGQRRLPGFSGEWRKEFIKNIVQTPVTDGPHLTPHFLNDGIPFLSVNNLVDGLIDFCDLRYISQADHEEFSRKCKPQKGDILLGKAASVGKVAIVETDVEFNIWSPIALIRPNNKNYSKYIYYQLQSDDVNKQISLLTNTSSQGNIGMGDIEKIVVPIPDKDEQVAIAETLTTLDAEIAELKIRVRKALKIKQAMMQELLTGRIRLI